MDVGFVLLLIIIIGIVVIIAWLLSIMLFVDVAKEKGYWKDGAGVLWFIGIFASPIVLGLYVVSLKPKSNDVIPASNSRSFIENKTDFPEL